MTEPAWEERPGWFRFLTALNGVVVVALLVRLVGGFERSAWDAVLALYVAGWVLFARWYDGEGIEGDPERSGRWMF